MRWILVWVFALVSAPAQQPVSESPRLVESGKIMVGGQETPYLIRRLPVSSFPDLPPEMAEQLDKRRCEIPQSYQAHHPENVVHASLERAGSSDWAVLCSADGKVSLLVFFAAASSKPAVLATASEKDRLQRHDSSGVLGFNWAIDEASPEAIHQAQSVMERKPPRLDHDALADIILDRKTIYHFFSKGAWKLVDMPQ